ncbi:periplasmic sensor sensor histidine kinase [Neisseria bacilliformis ATCC BAA-1200]|uniref:Periplasmic sensor sensor histidine kinase n=1 Tax=Neisseria bacilliformis ATCC BAA-1200 TaxID=888742 RepID=F2BBW9_9NEIS|nr:periplasmic sensor sensor histidine kinase [Neisseria bacilliformis ATCC BAA-1200]
MGDTPYLGDGGRLKKTVFRDAAGNACVALGRHTLRQWQRPSPPTRG